MPGVAEIVRAPRAGAAGGRLLKLQADTPRARPVPRRGTLVAYAAPSAVIGFTLLIIQIYLLKFATDELGLAPSTLGLLFGLAGLWDAVSDPLVGYATDRSRSRFGRRRPWIAAGALPLAACFAMLWAPPASLQGGALVLWMGAALLGFYTALTVVDVPHSALGAELSTSYHARTRIFGWRRVAIGLGGMGAVAAIAGFEGGGDARQVGRWMALGAALLAVATIAAMVAGTRERPDYQGRGAARATGAARDVLRNPHARRLLAAFVIQHAGIMSLSIALPFLSEYVLRTPGYTFAYLGALFASSLAAVPLWLRIAPHADKRTLLLASMSIVALAVLLLFFAGPGQVAYVLGIAVVGGVGAAGADVVGPSLQADVIDWDELQTRERKEGAYFAAWAFAIKTAGAASAMLVGLTLDAAGFVPNAEQSEGVQLVLRLLCSLGPAVFYSVGIAILLGFRLTAAEHGRIRAALDAEAARPHATPGGVS